MSVSFTPPRVVPLEVEPVKKAAKYINKMKCKNALEAHYLSKHSAWYHQKTAAPFIYYSSPKVPIFFGKVELEGPFSSLEELENRAGLFAILCVKDEQINLLDVQRAKLVQTDVAKVLRDPGWGEVCSGKIRVAVLYLSDEQEMEQLQEEILEGTRP